MFHFDQPSPIGLVNIKHLLLKDFTDGIIRQFEDKVELTIMLENISKDLDIRIQKIIIDLLNKVT
jgi:hypothetical protein